MNGEILEKLILMKQCKYCEKEIKTTNKRKEFCGNSCVVQYRKNGNKKIDGVEGIDYLVCPICRTRLKELGNHYKKFHPTEVTPLKNKCQKLCNAMTGEKNPAYQHGGKNSPWSMKSIFHTVEEIKSAKEKAVKNSLANCNNATHSTKIEYYTNKGIAIDEAKNVLRERQTTFSLDICIEKYGEIEGNNRWKLRQDKWQRTLDTKTDEEKSEINRKKIWKNGRISKIEQEIFDSISQYVKIEQQFKLQNGINWYWYDFHFDGHIIEFYGDYWHGNPYRFTIDNFKGSSNKSLHDIWQFDKTKDDFAVSHGFKTLIIWERDYRKDKEGTLDKCIKFLTH